MIQRNEIWKIYGTEYRKMTKTLLEAAGLAGIIEAASARDGGREGADESGRRNEIRIGIKPNLVTPAPADFGGTTHPEVVAGIIEYLRERGFGNLLIAEGSWVGDRTSEAYEICGYRDLCERYDVPFIDTQEEHSHEVNCAGMKLSVTDVTDRVDFWINVPVLKGHCQTKMTCALKNWKGLIPNKEKRRFHTMGLHKPIAHLQKAIRQDFIVVDHICGDLDFEEGGNPVVRNCIMAALDPVLTDSYACRLLHYTPDDVPYVRIAEALGIGSADLGKAEILRISAGGDKEVLPKDALDEELPGERRILEVSYAVDEVDSCSACYGSLTGALWRLEREGLLKKLNTRIGIGQGMRGKTGVLGIGRCTKDFDFCIMGCPPDEDTIYRELRRYIETANG